MALLDSPFEMTYGPCQDQSSSLPALGRLALCIIRDPLGAFQVGERTPTRATQTETSPPLHSASPSSTLHHTFTTDLTLVSCGCSKCSIYRSEAGCLEGVWHALYAKSKLVPLTPTSDISVGYSSIYIYECGDIRMGPLGPLEAREARYNG